MRKKVLFIVDTRGWAYDDAAKNWKRLLKEEYDIDILYLDEYEGVQFTHKFYRLFKEYQDEALKGNSVSLEDILVDKENYRVGKKTDIDPLFDHNKYDGIYIFYHRALCDSRLAATPFPLGKVAIAINNEKWVDMGAKREYNTYMKGVKVLVGCNSFIMENFKKVHPNTFRASQAINPLVFRKDREQYVSGRIGERMIIGWSGNYSNPIKNFAIVKKACLLSGVKLVKARDLNRKQLNKWYNEVDAVICTSKSEGGPLMLLEAGAVGLPVLTTPVGLAREIIQHNKNGMLIKWDPHAIAKEINLLSIQMDKRKTLGRTLQKQINSKWTYEARLKEIRAVLKELCNG